MRVYDFIVVGAGAAGLPCAIFGARSRARVLLVEKQAGIGGALRVSDGRLSAAGTKRQAERGIADSTEAHFGDIQSLSNRTAREDLVRLALLHSAWLVDWLQDQGFEFAADSPSQPAGEEPSSVPRSYCGVDEGRSILKVFFRLAKPLLESGALTLALSSKVKALLTDKGRVVGVQFARNGQIETARARRGVVLATGGFAASPELFRELEGAPMVSLAPEHATGDGLRMAQGLGAGIAGRGTFFPLFGGLSEPGQPQRASRTDRPLFDAKARPPYEIFVDRFGKRFVAEDDPSVDRRQRALTKVDGLTFFSVFDARAVEASENMVPGWSKADLKQKAGQREGFFAAPSLESLGRLAGIDGEGLLRTVERYNHFVRDAKDADFGRKFLPRLIEAPPFYAMRNHGVAATTFAGVDVDSALRVRREDGSIIDGLYAAGEILGASATSGNARCSGMVLGPALIFGKLIGERLGGPQDGALTAEMARPEGLPSFASAGNAEEATRP